MSEEGECGMDATTFETATATWTCEPFINEDGIPYIRMGMHGDDHDYAAVNVVADDMVRSSRFFLDIGARVEEVKLVLDMVVEMGRITLHERDEILRERFRALAGRLAVNLQPASPLMKSATRARSAALRPTTRASSSSPTL